MREVELKAVVGDWDAARERLEAAGAALAFDGRLADRRYDTPGRDLAARDEVLRLRVYRTAGSAHPPAGRSAVSGDSAGAASATRAQLGWKGPTQHVGGYKVREEHETPVGNADVLAEILVRLGYVVTRAIDRVIVQYDLEGTTVRLERYPRMDDLVEVEGTPEGIERTIALLRIPRSAFSTDRLPQFVARFQTRTGQTAALCDAELDGTTPYRLDDA